MGTNVLLSGMIHEKGPADMKREWSEESQRHCPK